jgi:penicillin-binding protein 2
MFVAFAPRENPQIAICAVVENAGFGSSAAGPIVSLMIEKFLNDTLSEKSAKKAEEFSKKDLMPSILKVEQFIADSTRAYYYFNLTKDSSYLRKFLNSNVPDKKPDTAKKTLVVKTTLPKPTPQKPAPSDTQRLGLLQRDEWWEHWQRRIGRKEEAVV